MRRQEVERRLSLGSIGVAAAVWAAGLSVPVCPVWGVPVATTEAVSTPSPQVDSAASLKRIFAGAAPASVADLRAMQDHVLGLTEKIKQCTVGVEVGVAQGSGVIISKDGYVLTAAHVAAGPRSRRNNVVLTLSTGRKVKARTLGLFRTLDAGLLKITDPGDYPYAEMGRSDVLKEGQWCLAMGHPGGYQSERGAVLRLGRILTPPKEDGIITDCTLVGGDSGGPLFDLDGRVIGINSRIGEKLTVNIHVPVAAFQDTWDRLLQGDVWGHLPGHDPYLGVTGDAEAKDAKVAAVKPESPAAEAGLKPGDVVTQFDGKEIATFDALKSAVDDCQPGERVQLRVRRGEQSLDIELRLGRRESIP